MSNLQRILRQVTNGILLLSCTSFASTTFAEDIFRAQGEMTGEVSANSAIVQTRLTSIDRNVDGDVPGAVGVARFEYATNKTFEASQMTPWNTSQADTDYIIRVVLRDLQPGTRYHYRVHFGANRETTQGGPTCSFRTLQGASGSDAVSFVVVTGMMYGYFHGTVGPGKDEATGSARFTFMDDLGNVLYEIDVG